MEKSNIEYYKLSNPEMTIEQKDRLKKLMMLRDKTIKNIIYSKTRKENFIIFR